jgi:hypothetical protein
MTIRAKLREELTRRFIPAVNGRGYVGPSVIAGNALFYEFRRPCPIGSQTLTLQLDKYQRPRFKLNLHVEPANGFDTVIASGGTVVHGFVTPNRGALTSHWFRADRPWWQRLVGIRSSREAEAVTAAIGVLDEVEQWWQHPVDSQNIRTIPIAYRKKDVAVTSH